MNAKMGYLLKYSLSSFFIIQLCWYTRAEQQIQCNSMKVQSKQDFYKLQKCTIVVGSVTFIDVHFSEKTLKMLAPSNVTEITDYLLIHRVTGLDTLEHLLPKLAVIRGRELLFDRYALIIYENRNLQNIGLVSLLRIFRGSIRIQSNPSLCYVYTVNWMAIMPNTTQYHYVLKNNKPPNYCPLCGSSNDWPQNGSKHCWSFDKYQKQLSTNLAMQCSSDGCNNRNPTKSKCSAICHNIPNNLHLCNGYLLNNTCVKFCTFPYVELNKRECISPRACHDLSRIPFAGECREQCPINYEKYKDENGAISCRDNCTGNFVVNTQNDLNGLADCSIIVGSLTIELLEMKSPVITELERTFANLREISDYLKIVHNPQIVSLGFFRKLHTIGGNHLIENRYALYVVNNYYLEELWNPNQQVAILKGLIYFHLNFRLCYNRILQLQSQLRSASSISIKDVSRNSNGERVICTKIIHELNATVEDFSDNSARIRLNPMSSEDKDLLYGYIYYYKISPYRNATMYDGRHGCGHDNWHMEFSNGVNIRHVLTNLKPYTQYAYFVSGLTSMDFQYQMHTISKVNYFTTMPSIPDPPARIFYRSISTSEIEIHWWPPHNPNGIIKNYLLDFKEIADTTNTTFYKQTLPSNPTKAVCMCSNDTNQMSGPWPNQEDYYNKEQLVYDETIQNLIYVSVAKSDRTLKKTEKLNRTVTDKLEQKFLELHEIWEKRALAEQDTGISSFPIIKPKPICKIPNATIQYQQENMCENRINYKGTPVPGYIHFYSLSNLLPHKTYRIYVRACVEGLENNCGAAITLMAETISKPLATILNTFRQY